VTKLGWRGAVGIAVSAICLYFAFRNFQWHEALDRAKQANYGLLLLATVAATGMFPLRARRWRTILDPVAPHLPFGPLWRATAIGVMITNVIPARAGELARALAAHGADADPAALLGAVGVEGELTARLAARIDGARRAEQPLQRFDVCVELLTPVHFERRGVVCGKLREKRCEYPPHRERIAQSLGL